MPRGEITLHSEIPRNYYYGDESIKVDLSIENLCNLSIRKVKLKLVRRLQVGSYIDTVTMNKKSETVLIK